MRCGLSYCVKRIIDAGEYFKSPHWAAERHPRNGYVGCALLLAIAADWVEVSGTQEGPVMAIPSYADPVEPRHLRTRLLSVVGLTGDGGPCASEGTQ